MLTINQIVKIYHEGNDVVFRKARDCKKGKYDPGELAIIIYSNNAESECDRTITILHEFIHAYLFSLGK